VTAFEDTEVELPDGPPVDEPELHDQEPAKPPEQGLQGAVPVGPPQFNFNDRLYALGYSTSGKSEVLNLLFSGVRCQKLLIDNKPEFAIDDIEPVHAPDRIDWTEPVIHYQPAPGSDHTQYEEIFAQAFTRRGLTICVHELGALVDYNANRAGRYLISYLSQGARLGLGLLAGTQRPVYVPVSGMTEAKHVLVFTPQLARREDNDSAAQALSPVDGRPLSTNEMIAELGSLHHEQGAYSFLWKDRGTGQLIALPPLPDHLRDSSIVRRVPDDAPRVELRQRAEQCGPAERRDDRRSTAGRRRPGRRRLLPRRQRQRR
jgi:hypothetical protein